MSCSFVGTEGLQKEFGHDRVRPPSLPPPAAPVKPPHFQRTLARWPPRFQRTLARWPPHGGHANNHAAYSTTIKDVHTRVMRPPQPLVGPPPPPQAHIVLNLTADLRSEFSWNTKQIFVYVNFDFSTQKNARNQMVMWSAILEDKARAHGGGGPAARARRRGAEGVRRCCAAAAPR